MYLREFYLQQYPTDNLALEIKESKHFAGLLNALYQEESVYDFIGVEDSLVRERLFLKLSKILDVEYNFVYNLWINNQQGATAPF